MNQYLACSTYLNEMYRMEKELLKSLILITPLYQNLIKIIKKRYNIIDKIIV